jgi:hypothetical protein
MTQANISQFALQLGNAASPEVFATIEEVLSLSGFGKTNELIDVTNFDSGLVKEYIAGLADGAEITVEANYYQAATQQAALRSAVDLGATRNFQLINQVPSPDETFSFAAVCLSWTIEPSPTEQNRISFTLKITGDIT